jgi:shikimate dehydrogenase
MTPAPDRYAVIGHPVAHSRSPWIHAQFARQTGEHISYAALEIAPAELPARLRAFFARQGRGVNVTVPHKQAIMPLLDELSEPAGIAGAVNTVIRLPDGRLRGDNTDGSGFVRDLTRNLGISVAARRVLLLGAGGAARGLLAPLLALEPAELVIANRTPQRAAELAQRFAAHGVVSGCGFEQLGSQPFELIINATAAGLDQQLPPLPIALLEAAALCYDLVYAGGETRFVRWAREHGVARSVDGTGMLVEQAADAFLLWRGVRPDTAPVLAALAA